MPSANSNGITIEYEERGAGDPLLMIMGLGGQLTDWPEGLIDLLAERFRVITFDNRDIGLSTEFDWTPPSRWKVAMSFLFRRPTRAGYTINDMADDAAGLLDALGIESAHVVGMSMGGMIAQALTINHPTRVRSLASIMSTTGDNKHGLPARRVLLAIARAKPPTRETAAQVTTDMYALWAGSSWNHAEHFEMTTKSIERSWRPAGTERQVAAINASPDRTEALGSITQPTVVIHGLEDLLVKPDGGTATCAAIPGSRLVMFPDMGHDLPRTRWPEILVAIASNAARAAAVRD